LPTKIPGDSFNLLIRDIKKINSTLFALDGAVQSTTHQTIHLGLCAALIAKALAIKSNYKCVALHAVDRTTVPFTDTIKYLIGICFGYFINYRFV
jgi:hypothetical protein